jgi:hypothetical protein
MPRNDIRHHWYPMGRSIQSMQCTRSDLGNDSTDTGPPASKIDTESAVERSQIDQSKQITRISMRANE